MGRWLHFGFVYADTTYGYYETSESSPEQSLLLVSFFRSMVDTTLP